MSTRTEAISRCLMAVSAAERQLAGAYDAKLAADQSMGSLVEECKASDLNWQMCWAHMPYSYDYDFESSGDAYRENASVDKIMIRVDEVQAEMKRTRSELTAARRRLNKAFQDLGKAVACQG